MSYPIPKLHKTVCISDNAVLAAEISSLYRKRGYYFAVLDSPRMARTDASNEVIRRNNVCARIKTDHVLLTDLEDRAIQEFSKMIKSPPLENIKNKGDIESKLVKSKNKSREILNWGPQNLAIGLLKAKKSGMRLQVDLENSPDQNFLKGENSHLVVFEERTDVAAIIAANYTFSIGASFIQIPFIKEEIVQEILESFYSIYSNNKEESVSTKISNLMSTIRNLLPEIITKNIECITFITNGMPWGFAFPEIPNTHILSYPDMGNTIANAISSSQKSNEGTRVALIIDPGKENNSELESVSKILAKQGTIVKKLFHKNATVFNAENNVRVFPFDILFISTHAGEISGRRLTYKFIDSENIERVIVVDEAVGFGIEPGSDMVNVLEYERFVSLDGIPWDDSDKKKKHYIGFAIRDYTELKHKDDKKLKLINVEDIDRVYGAMALRMYDNDLLTGAFHSIADGNTPIVFNNSCSSWKEMSKSFTFGGAIAYIGTLFPITDIEAKELTSNLFSKNNGKQLAFALWRAQKQTYNSLRHPYVMLGPHFLKINSPKVKTDDYLLAKLLSGKKNWEEKFKRGIDEGVKRNSKVYAEFLDKEIIDYIQYYKSINKQ